MTRASLAPAGLKRQRSTRERNLRIRYGITAEDVALKLADQGGGCAVCGATESGGKGWHVDHDHDTGKFRGVLCMRCNMTLLGWHRDNPDSLDERAVAHEERAQLLRRAATYLREASL